MAIYEGPQMTKKIVRTTTIKRKNTAKNARNLPRTARAPKPRSTTTRQPKEARSTPSIEQPEPLTARDCVQDAIAGLEEARRAFDDMEVYRFRGKHDLAQFEHVVFHENLLRVHDWLTRLDIHLPEDVEIGQ
jgi:hypothetical protein